MSFMGEKSNILKSRCQVSLSFPVIPSAYFHFSCLPGASQYPPWSHPGTAPSLNLGLGPEEGVADIADFLVESPLLIHALDAAVRVVLGVGGDATDSSQEGPETRPRTASPQARVEAAAQASGSGTRGPGGWGVAWFWGGSVVGIV